MYTILSLSDSDKHFDSALDEYIKRMSKTLQCISLKPSKADNKDYAKKTDTDTILVWLEKHAHKYDSIVLLSILWKDLTTEQWYSNFPLGKKACFILGWPHGLEEAKILEYSHSIIAIGLWKQTMVHGLAKLVLIEQVYRIWMMQQWRNYHY